MAKQLLVLEEVLAMLKTTGAPNRVIEKFREHVETVLGIKPSKTTDDNVQVASGYGALTQRGFVEFTLNEQRTQMEPKKAREIALMLLEASEAAMSDEIFVALLTDKLGIDPERAGMVLLDLREIRQGSRSTVYPQ